MYSPRIKRVGMTAIKATSHVSTPPLISAVIVRVNTVGKLNFFVRIAAIHLSRKKLENLL